MMRDRRFGVFPNLFASCALVFSALVTSGFGVEFDTLKLEWRPSALSITESGDHLVAVSSRQDRLHVIDSRELEELLVIEVPATGPLLSRGGTLLVGERDTGLVKIYSQKDWELVNEIDTGVTPLEKLSAKRGGAYDGTLLASKRGLVHVVDVEKDEYRAVGRQNSQAIFSANGDHVLHHADGKFTAFDSDKYLRGELDDPVSVSSGSNVSDPVPLVDDFWLGRGRIYVGLAPHSQMEYSGGAIVGDPSPETRLVYCIKDKNIEVRRLDSAFSLLETIVMESSFSSAGNSPPCIRRNGDSSISLFWVGHGVDGVASVTFRVTAPVRANEVGTQVIPLPAADENQLVSGPDGTKLDDGKLSWTPPTAPDPGRYAFKVKQTNNGKVSFFRESIEVLSAEKVELDGITQLKSEPGTSSRIPVGSAEDQMVILDEGQLLLFDESGMITRSIPFEEKYHDVVLLDQGFALAATSRIDITDADGKVLGEIDLGSVTVTNIAAGADGKTLFASAKDSTEQELAKSFPVYHIDLESRKANRLERVAGSGLAMHRGGDLLMSFISHRQMHSVGLLNYIEENTDVLIGYRVNGDRLSMQKTSEGVVTGIRSLSYSADGSHVAVNSYGVLSRGGMTYGQRIPVFSVKNLDKPDRMVPIEGGGVIQSLFHPKLDLLCVLSHSRQNEVGYRMAAYHVDGDEREKLLSAGSRLPSQPDQFMFSPDGTALLVVGRDIYGRRLISRLGLELSDEERARCAKPAPAALPVFAPSIAAHESGTLNPDRSSGDSNDGLAPSDFERLVVDSSSRSVIPSEAMAMLHMPSVVIVNSGQKGIGAGFFVSRDGHIMTAAHCLPPLGGPMVSHYLQLPIGRIEFESPATVVDVDEDLDLALLKIDFNASTTALSLANRDPIVGAKVYAIGHPGTKELSLDYTLTEGLVSSAARQIEGRSVLQISAAVNPGNSGGPVIDERGCIIGMVTQKAHLEGASFAVPAGLIADFLDRSKASSELAPPDAGSLKKEIEDKGWLTMDKLSFKSAGPQGNLRARLKGEPDEWFTGTMVMFGNPADHLLSTSNYKDGYLDGDTIIYDRMKRRVRLMSFQSGEEHGLQGTYYPSQNLRSTLTKKQGKLHGYLREFYDEPLSVKSAVCFENGVPSGPSYVMDELGRVVYAAFYKDGQAATQRQYNHHRPNEGVPVIEYTKAGDDEVLSELVKKGASLDELYNGKAPLHEAVEIKYIYMVETILDLGGEVDIKDGNGKTALQLVMASSNPALSIARMLIERGAEKSLLTDEERKLLEE